MQRFTHFRPLLAGFFALFCALPAGFGQLSKHGLIWHFGNHAGLDFSSGVPVPITGSAMDSYEGCSSYCDANGQLLFYSNGGGNVELLINGLRDGVIWNRNNQVMYNMGQNQGGGYSAAQSALVLPKPGSADRYLQFTMDHIPNPPAQNRGLSYFEVDMTLNGGLGGVVQANVPVFKPATESLTAVRHANGQDFWLIAIDKNTQAFVVVPLTAAGVGQPQSQVPNGHAAGTESLVIKASPDGRFLCTGGDLYAFDPATGTLTFLQTLGVSNYSFSFSPASRYLYAFETDAAANLVRYDLLTPSPAQTINDVPEATFTGLMQLGPDGNIYFAEQLLEDFFELVPPVSLSVVRCPDGGAPELERAIMKFPTDVNNAGGLFTSLPNFADYIFAATGSGSPHDTVQKQICLMPIVLQPTVTGIHYQWSTGDTTAQLTVLQPGTYTVEVQTLCGSAGTTFLVQSGGAEVTITAPPITGDTCRALPLTLHASAGMPGSFLWSDGSTTDSLVITEFGTYTVRFTGACGMDADTFQLAKPEADCCQPQFPNAFTPNGDNLNDLFAPIIDYCDIEFIDFLVYDRWGELVFQGYEPGQKWDGLTLNATEAPSDVYVYWMRYKRRNQAQEQVAKGEITLLR